MFFDVFKGLTSLGQQFLYVLFSLLFSRDLNGNNLTVITKTDFSGLKHLRVLWVISAFTLIDIFYGLQLKHSSHPEWLSHHFLLYFHCLQAHCWHGNSLYLLRDSFPHFCPCLRSDRNVGSIAVVPRKADIRCLSGVSFTTRRVYLWPFDVDALCPWGETAWAVISCVNLRTRTAMSVSDGHDDMSRTDYISGDLIRTD